MMSKIWGVRKLQEEWRRPGPWGTGMLLSSDHVLSADMGRWRLLRGNSVVVRNSEGSCCRSSIINMIKPTELL